jgi:hypothetical protein
MERVNKIVRKTVQIYDTALIRSVHQSYSGMVRDFSERVENRSYDTLVMLSRQITRSKVKGFVP